MTPTLPPEFFSIPELQGMSNRKQRARILAWLKNERIPYITGGHGWPLVYRNNLLPQQPAQEQNGATIFNFSAARATSRKTAQA